MEKSSNYENSECGHKFKHLIFIEMTLSTIIEFKNIKWTAGVIYSKWAWFEEVGSIVYSK